MKKIREIPVRRDEDSYLTLDPSVLREKRQSGKSVTDASGVNVFTDDFRQRMDLYESINRDKTIWNQVFTENMNNQPMEMGLTEFLFQSPITGIRAESQAVQSGTRSILQGAVLSVMCVGFAVFIYQYHKGRRKQREIDSRY